MVFTRNVYVIVLLIKMMSNFPSYITLNPEVGLQDQYYFESSTKNIHTTSSSKHYKYK